MLLLIGPTLFTPQVFLFSISLLFVNKYHYFIETYVYTDATLKLGFEKLKPTTFLKLSVQNDTSIWIVQLKIYANHLLGIQVMEEINLQCNNLSQTHSSVFFRLKIV